MFENWNRRYLSPEPGEGGGEGGTDGGDKGGEGGEKKKLAGKYSTSEELEKGYKELESSHGKTTAEIAQLRRELDEQKSSSQRAKSDEAVNASVREAEKALEDFNDKTDWEDLSKTDTAKKLREQGKLERAVEEARAARDKTKQSASHEEVRKKVIESLMTADYGEASKLAKHHSIDLDELEKFAQAKDCGTRTEAIYRMLYEKDHAEVERLQKLEKDMKDGRVQKEPVDKTKPPDKDHKPTPAELEARIKKMPTTAAFEKEMRKLRGEA